MWKTHDHLHQGPNHIIHQASYWPCVLVPNHRHFKAGELGWDLTLSSCSGPSPGHILPERLEERMRKPNTQCAKMCQHNVACPKPCPLKWKKRQLCLSWAGSCPKEHGTANQSSNVEKCHPIQYFYMSIFNTVFFSLSTTCINLYLYIVNIVVTKLFLKKHFKNKALYF